jgi:ABC-2 type transport system permease protein
VDATLDLRPPPPRARRTPLVRAVVAHARVELLLLLRSGESLLVTLGIPLGVLVFFSLVDDVLPTGDRDAGEFLVPGVLAISVMAAGLVALGISTAFERKYGVLKLLGGSPLPRWGLLTGKALAVLAVLTVQTGLILGVAVLGLGWEPRGGVPAVLLALVLGTATFSALGLLVAGTFRAEATLAVVNAVFLLLLFISGVAFDPGELPDAVAAVGALLPSWALGEALRAALDSPARIDVDAIGLLAGWGAAAVVLAARTFRWSP